MEARQKKTVLRKIGYIPQLWRGTDDPRELIRRLLQLIEDKRIGLTLQQYRAIKLRLEGKTLREAAKLMGLTWERIGQHENNAARKIRKLFGLSKPIN